MSIIKDCWQGRSPLGQAFWVYHIGIPFALFCGVVTVGSLLSPSSQGLLAFGFIAFLLVYQVLALVSVWRCAKNSPSWGSVARAWVLLVVVGFPIFVAIKLLGQDNYTTRSRVTEGLSSAGAAKLAVAETLATTGAFPADNAAARLPAANTIRGKYVESVTVGAAGVLAIKFSSLIGGDPTMNAQTITLTPTDNRDYISWQCAIAADTTRYKYVPAECRN